MKEEIIRWFKELAWCLSIEVLKDIGKDIIYNKLNEVVRMYEYVKEKIYEESEEDKVEDKVEEEEKKEELAK